MSEKQHKYSETDICNVMGIDFLPEQLVGITAKPEPGVIIASAGSGKTAVMAARVVHLVANEIVPAEKILGLTFTNLATGELRSRVRQSLAKLGVHTKDTTTSAEPFVTTYHAFASQMIKQFGMLVGIEPDHQVISDVRRQQLAARTISRSTVDFSKLTVTFNYILDRMLSLDDSLADSNVSIEAFEEFARKLILDADILIPGEPKNKFKELGEAQLVYAQLVREFREQKMFYNALDYADMNRLALEIFNKTPMVREQMREQFQMVLLDEYQDTSIAQRVLIQSLFNDGHPVNAVGDPLQSIYAFRGASAKNISKFPKHFKLANGEESAIVKLPITQRNGKNIVELANVLTDRLRQPDAHPELVPLQPPAEPKYGPGKVHISSFRTMDEEAAWIIKEIKECEAAGIPLEEVALLLRKGKGIAWALKFLNEAGIPAQVRTKMDLLEVPEIVELISILRVIAEPAANSAWVRILTGPRWRIGNRDLAIIGKHASRMAYDARVQGDRGLDKALDAAIAGSDIAENTAYGDAIADIVENGNPDLSNAALERIKNLHNEIQYLRAQAGDPLKHFVYRVASVSGLLIESIAEANRIKRGMDSNLRAFFSLVSDFTALDGESNLFALLRWIDDSKKHDTAIGITSVAHEGAVQLITVHSAKGLQFRVVGLPQMSEGIFPVSTGSDNWVGNAHVVPYELKDEEVDVVLKRFPLRTEAISKESQTEYDNVRKTADALEERRLAYVALTRAEEMVFISSSALDPSVQEPRMPSVFFNEILESARGNTEEIEKGNIRIGEIHQVIKVKGEKTNIVESEQWPVQLNSPAIHRVQDSAARVKELIHSEFKLSPASNLLVEEWDKAIKAIEREIAMHDNPIRLVPLPESLSVTQIQRLSKDEESFVANLIRPMPTEPAPAAAQGTAFHAFVEHWAHEAKGGSVASPLPDMETLDQTEDEFFDLPTLEKFKATFRRSIWAKQVPHIVEAPFAISLGGYIVRGRIDAVYKDGDTYTLVDWKTNAEANADPLQLAIYRLAWADSLNIPLENIKASFYYVALDETVTPEAFPSREEIIKLLT
jgi:DNA helicase-2/ATP-dependent DNA helicase PcrA